MHIHAENKVTPKPYLSWSQYNLFRNSQMRYVSTYIYGERFQNEEMDKGRELAEILEKDEKVDDSDIESVRIMLPTLKEREYEIETSLGDVPLYGKFDGFDEKNLVLDEIKSGKNGWDQRKVDNCEQITFYSLMIYQKFKKLPKKIRLHYAPTERVAGTIRFTGEVESFVTERSLNDVLGLLVPIKRTWEGIQKVSLKEYKSLGKYDYQSA